MLDRIAARLRTGARRPLGVGAGALALAGSLLVLAATAYGEPVAALAGIPCFALGAAAWQVADRLGDDPH